MESLFDRLLVADSSLVVEKVWRLDAGERARLDGWGNRAVLARPAAAGVSVPVLFGAQVARTPDAVAVSCAGRSMTYLELDEAANRLAHLLTDRGVGPGQVWRCCFRGRLRRLWRFWRY